MVPFPWDFAHGANASELKEESTVSMKISAKRGHKVEVMRIQVIIVKGILQRSPSSLAIMNTPKQRQPNKEQLQENPTQAEYSQTSIEDLPEGILIDILSFLPTAAAIKTTAIAPPWRNLWHAVPSLDFDMFSFHSNILDKSIPEARELFAEFINQTLIHRPFHFPLRKFKLWFCYRNSVQVQSYVHSWLETVIGCKLVELDLHFTLEDEDDYTDDDGLSFYSPEFLSLSDSSVEILKLCGIDLRIPGEAFSLKFDSIREVHLKNFRSLDKDIEHLMALCVNLESLSLVRGEGWKNLIIMSQKLKHFKLFHFNELNLQKSSVEICAPNLESINLYCVYADKFSLEKTPSLVEAKVIFIRRSWWDLACWTNVVSSLGGIERLTIQNLWPWYLYFLLVEFPAAREVLGVCRPEIEGFEIPSFVLEVYDFKLQPRKEVFSDSFVFHNLKHIELWTGFSEDDVIGLGVLFDRSPQLTSMVLISKYNSYLDNYNHNFGGINKLFLPCLKLVEMMGFGATKNETCFVELLVEHGGKLEKIIVYPRTVNGGISLLSPVVLYENLDLPC